MAPPEADMFACSALQKTSDVHVIIMSQSSSIIQRKSSQKKKSQSQSRNPQYVMSQSNSVIQGKANTEQIRVKVLESTSKIQYRAQIQTSKYNTESKSKHPDIAYVTAAETVRERSENTKDIDFQTRGPEARLRVQGFQSSQIIRE